MTYIKNSFFSKFLDLFKLTNLGSVSLDDILENEEWAILDEFEINDILKEFENNLKDECTSKSTTDSPNSTDSIYSTDVSMTFLSDDEILEWVPNHLPNRLPNLSRPKSDKIKQQSKSMIYYGDQSHVDFSIPKCKCRKKRCRIHCDNLRYSIMPIL